MRAPIKTETPDQHLVFQFQFCETPMLQNKLKVRQVRECVRFYVDDLGFK